MANFSRTSTAYKQDGSVVAAGVPRFESNGVMVEEGTTNLVTSQNMSISPWNNGTNTIVTQVTLNGKTWNEIAMTAAVGTFSQFAISVTSGTTYTFSFRCKNTLATEQIISYGFAVTSGSGATLGAQTVTLSPYSEKIYSSTITASSTTTFYLTIDNNVNTNVVDFFVSDIQLEAKPYATSFHPTARAAESLTIPASAINASEGSIEFDCVMTKPSSLAPSGVLWGLFAATDGLFTVCQLNHQSRVAFFRGNWAGARVDAVWSAGDLLHFGIKWINTMIAMVVTNKTTGLSWSAVNNTSVDTPITLIKFSTGASVDAPINALFSNLRISNKARSDAELAYTGALAGDEFTTYFLPLNGNLSATCHPVMLAQGSGQVLLSRVGRGTRPIKVQGSGQVKLKRSACYYPTIAVGTKGEVQLSRQGIGYRKMKVEGQGSFKIQEPNIEIYPEIRERESTTEVIGVPYAGDTIKIKGSFKSFEGVAADPTSITLKIYDTINNLLTTINVTSANRVSAGIYEVNYTVPDGYQALYYEWHCVQGDSPQVTMGKIIVLKRGQA